MRPTSPGAEQFLGQSIPVLDHGSVTLVNYMGSDEEIERAQLQSTGLPPDPHRTRGRIRYLMRKRHTGPFEFCELTLNIKAPLFVARQWLRTRTASTVETSGRYQVISWEFYTPEHFRGEALGGIQGVLAEELEEHSTAAKEIYESSLAFGVVREHARLPIPLNAYTTWTWKIDLHNLFNFLRLRSASEAQWEIQEYSRAIEGIVKVAFPLAYEAWCDYVRDARTFSAQEMAVIRALLDTDRAAGVLELTGLSSNELREFREKLE